jgi:hypothetical protein
MLLVIVMVWLCGANLTKKTSWLQSFVQQAQAQGAAGGNKHKQQVQHVVAAYVMACGAAACSVAHVACGVPHDLHTQTNN